MMGFVRELDREAAERDEKLLKVSAILRDVSELPDRTSPEDWPDVMLVTADELKEILLRYL